MVGVMNMKFIFKIFVFYYLKLKRSSYKSKPFVYIINDLMEPFWVKKLICLNGF